MKFTKLSVLIIGSLVFAGCSLLPQKAEPISAPEVMDESPQEDAMMEADEAMMEGKGDEIVMENDDKVMMVGDHKVVMLNASNFSFGVEEIEVGVGDKLVLEITNDEGFHDLLIDELGVDTGNIPEGDTFVIEIPTDKAGTYEYYCSVGNHRDQGMKGTLTIK